MRVEQEVPNLKHFTKMRINEVLECANKAIDEIRNKKNINARGHFVSTTEIQKAMGPYKQCATRIVYVNLDKHSTSAFCGASIMERCLSENEEKMIKKVETQALTQFFIYQHMEDIWEQIIKGEYGTE